MSLLLKETLPCGRPDHVPPPLTSTTPSAKSVFTPVTLRPPKPWCENPSGYVNKVGVCVRTWQHHCTCSALYMGAKSLFRSCSCSLTNQLQGFQQAFCADTYSVRHVRGRGGRNLENRASKSLKEREATEEAVLTWVYRHKRRRLRGVRSYSRRS